MLEQEILGAVLGKGVTIVKSDGYGGEFRQAAHLARLGQSVLVVCDSPLTSPFYTQDIWFHAASAYPNIGIVTKTSDPDTILESAARARAGTCEPSNMLVVRAAEIGSPTLLSHYLCWTYYRHFYRSGFNRNDPEYLIWRLRVRDAFGDISDEEAEVRVETLQDNELFAPLQGQYFEVAIVTVEKTLFNYYGNLSYDFVKRVSCQVESKNLPVVLVTGEDLIQENSRLWPFRCVTALPPWPLVSKEVLRGVRVALSYENLLAEYPLTDFGIESDTHMIVSHDF